MNLKDKVCLDIGASTGGFVDVMLKEGAGLVYAVDVGYGQLDWKLRNSKKVICLERKNARYLSMADVPSKIDMVTMDVSFISVKKIIPNLLKFLHPGSSMVILIKPQFESERKFVAKGGIVKDSKVHIALIESIIEFCKSIGFSLAGLIYSPLKGASGNIEYLAYFLREVKTCREVDVKQIVCEAFASLS